MTDFEAPDVVRDVRELGQFGIIIYEHSLV